MKKLLTILFFFIISFAQSQDYRQIDWKFIVSDVVLINTDTFQINAIPIDFNDKGAIDRVVGNYVIDFVARCFKVIDSTSTTLTVVDLAHENIAPQTNQIARCYRSVLNGASLFSSIGGVDISVIDELSRWKDVARNNELFARAIDSLALTVTDIKTANYTAGINEFIRCNVVGGGFTVTLPDAPTDRTLMVIQSINIVSSANILEITTSGTDVLAIPGGPTSIYIGLALETVSMQYDTSGVWVLEHTAPPSNFATNFPGIDAQTPIPSSAISINYTTRVLTVTPPEEYFQFTVDGGGKSTRFRKDTSVDFPAWDDVSGIWYLFFNNLGTAVTTQTPWTNFNTIAAVYRLLWNATLSGSAKSIVENIETHENTISGVDHLWKHNEGTKWVRGLDCFNNALPSGSPVAGGSETVVSFNSGSNIDDNLSYTIENSTGGGDWQQDLGELNPASLDATNSALMSIKYRDAANLLYVLPATRFPFAWDTGTNRPEYITATGVRTLVSNLSFFNYYVYSIQDPRTGEGLTLISATSEFGTITDAQAHSWSNIQSNYPNTNDGEVRPLYKYIFQYRSNYGVTNKYSVLREVTDIRKQEVTQGTTIAGSIAASQVTVVPEGNITETNVQAALVGLDTRLQTSDNRLNNWGLDSVLTVDNSSLLDAQFGDIISTGGFEFVTISSDNILSTAAPFQVGTSDENVLNLVTNNITAVTINVDRTTDFNNSIDVEGLVTHLDGEELFHSATLGNLADSLGIIRDTTDALRIDINTNTNDISTLTLDEVTVNGNSLSSGFLNYFNGTNIAPSPAFTDGTDLGLGTQVMSGKLDIRTDNSFAQTVFGISNSSGGPASSLFFRDLSSGSTDSPLVLMRQTNPNDDQAVLVIDQDGTGDIFQAIDATTIVFKIEDGGNVAMSAGATVADAPVTNTDVVRLEDLADNTFNPALDLDLQDVLTNGNISSLGAGFGSDIEISESDGTDYNGTGTNPGGATIGLTNTIAQDNTFTGIIFNPTRASTQPVHAYIGAISSTDGARAADLVFGRRTASNNYSEDMRIDATTGNILINTTTDNGFKLDVNGTFRAVGEGQFDAGATVADAPVIGIDIFRLDDATNSTINIDGLTISYNGDDLLGIISDSVQSVSGSGFNYDVQALSGTVDTLDVDFGLNATITLTGNTTIRLENLQGGMTGNITVTNPATQYTLTLLNSTFIISPFLTSSGDDITMSGSSATDGLSWYYDGTLVIINGTYDYQ
jgi:hypothetical protein